MNKIFIIGNGFDLAHQLKTKYKDFILWYINHSFESLAKTNQYEDELIFISCSQNLKQFKFNTIKEFTEYLTYARKNVLNFQFKYKNYFFSKIIQNHIEPRWVDIESFYYSEILKLYRIIENTNFDNHNSVDSQLQTLNKGFEFLKRQLIEYLNQIDIENIEVIPEIIEHFKHDLSRYNGGNAMFLIFNYTSTVEKYCKDPMITLNYIHGKLNDSSNPIIFGYGDEMDIFYERIERLNNNEFLKNMKSFGYFKTRNYQKLTNFLNNTRFEAIIMGHSCGISDRILLNSIFEHNNCAGIKLYYHQIDKNNNDYMDKTYEISRHFKRESKGLMRNKVKPFSDSKPLVSIN